MNEVFTLRQSSRSIEGRVERCGLGIRDITDGYQVVEMSCRIFRRNEQKQWLECNFGEMQFQDSHGNFHQGFYTDDWWRAQIPLKEPMEGVEYWPHELNEGSQQFIDTCETKRMSIAFPEQKITEALDEAYKENLEIEKDIVEEAKHLDLDQEMEETEIEPSEVMEGSSIEDVAEVDKLLEEQAKRVKEKEPPIYQCPICGATTTKACVPFKSWGSVKIHSRISHKVRLIDEKDRIKCNGQIK